MVNTDLLTLEASAIKAEISKTVTAYTGATKGFVALFIGLCDRFTGKDNHSGDNFEHLLNLLESSDNKTLKNRVINRLREFSDNSIDIKWLEEGSKWAVKVKRDEKDKTLFKKSFFLESVKAAKAAPNALTYTPNSTVETEEQREARLAEGKHKRYIKRVKSGEIEKEVSSELLDYAKALLETDTTITPEKVAIKLRALVESVMSDVKPVIEGNKA